jgi:hypothetical protein
MIRALALALMPGGALACAVHEPLQIGQFALDPVVVAGTVTAYAWDDWQAVLTVEVTGTLADQARGTLQVFWTASMGQMAPQTWDRPATVILGLTPPGRDAYWQLTVPICGDAHLLADTPANRAAVKSVLGEAP